MKKIAIVGGGAAGLAAAYRIQEEIQNKNAPCDCVLLEAGDNFGGKIRTERFDNFIVERGPDSFISQKPWGIELCHKLGLGDRLIGTKKEHSQTFVYTGGKMVPMPEGLSMMVPTKFLPFVFSPLFSWPGKIRMGLDLFIPRRADNGDESLASFVRRRLGQEALVKMAEPMLAGIYSADPETMSLNSTFPMFAQSEKKYRSLILGMLERKRQVMLSGKAPKPAKPGPDSLFVTLRDGLDSLVSAVIEKSTNVQFRKGQKLTGFAREGDQWKLSIEGGESITADAVIVALPANIASGLLQPCAPDVANRLEKIPYVSTAAVTLAYSRKDFSHPLRGFGFVVPRDEGLRITACTWTSSKYEERAPDDHVLMRCYVGGGVAQDADRLDENELEKIVRDDLLKSMNVRETPAFSKVYYNRKGNVQYQVGHSALIDSIDAGLQSHPGLFLAGSAYRGIGIPDCVLNGTRTAESALQYLSK